MGLKTTNWGKVGSRSRRRVKKRLSSKDDGHKPTDESDEEPVNVNHATIGGHKASDGENYEDEDVKDCEVNVKGHKRRRKRVITSDSENDDEDDDDNIPISILKNLTPRNQDLPDLVVTEEEESERGGSESESLDEFLVDDDEETVYKRRKRVITSDSENDDDDNIPISIFKNLKPRNQEMPDLVDTKEESDRGGSQSESESLDGFIVDDDDEVTDIDETDIADILSRLRRDKKRGKRKWEYEGDLLADFGKDDELCMRAVCVLYRFQSEGEKKTRSSYVANGRGFSQHDAERGTWIGEFLTDGDSKGDLKKSVEELESFNVDAVEICRDLANKYSKQLLKIYNNREDPFFAAPPSP